MGSVLDDVELVHASYSEGMWSMGIGSMVQE